MRRIQILEKLCKMVETKNCGIYNEHLGKVPTIYYIGLEKTGSASIKYGFKSHKVAHWHNEGYFQWIYGTKLLTKNGITLFDLIMYIAKKHKIKPLIIESIREPISRQISLFFQMIHIKKVQLPENNQLDFCIDKLKNETFALSPYSIKWKKYFGIDILKEYDPSKKYIYKDLDHVKLLFLKFEDIEMRPQIFKSIGYTYHEKHTNDSEKRVYAELYRNVYRNFGLPKNQLDKIYNTPIIKIFYSTKEIDGFKNKFKII